MRKRSRVSIAKPAGATSSRGERPLSVTQLATRITRALEENVGRVNVEGEISNLRVPRSGHAYFVLRDSDASINAVCFRSTLTRLAAEPADGRQVEVRGRVTAYTVRSEYQIIVESMREAGLGELMRLYLELRDRLKAEGLFDEDRKRPLPPYPRRVGVVTSATGAAVRDILSVLHRRAPSVRVLVSPCAVQGDAAPGEIVRALGRLERHGGCDVIIAGRGGGSIEDLWAFNDELVVRAIAACSIPVISAVGHETDTTLSDFAADRRAATPSVAAEMVSAQYGELGESVDGVETRLQRVMRQILHEKGAALEGLANSWAMHRPKERLGAAIQKADEAEQRLDRAFSVALDTAKARLLDLTGRLSRAHPSRQLTRARQSFEHVRARLRALHPETRWRPVFRLARSNRRQLERRADQAVRGRLAEGRLRLGAVAGRLEAVGPEAVLRRGFSIITTPGGRKIITAPGQARPGDALKVESAGGRWRATPLPHDEDELFDNL